MNRGDGLPEDRVTCAECKHADLEQLRCHRLKVSVIPNLPLRCSSFSPIRSLPDQRTGAERWPTLQGDIAALRAIEAAHLTKAK